MLGEEKVQRAGIQSYMAVRCHAGRQLSTANPTLDGAGSTGVAATQTGREAALLHAARRRPPLSARIGGARMEWPALRSRATAPKADRMAAIGLAVGEAGMGACNWQCLHSGVGEG